MVEQKKIKSGATGLGGCPLSAGRWRLACSWGLLFCQEEAIVNSNSDVPLYDKVQAAHEALSEIISKPPRAAGRNRR